MKKVFEEIGKALFNFANIITALVLLRDYFTKSDDIMLFIAIYTFIGLYLLASVFIKISGEKNE